MRASPHAATPTPAAIASRERTSGAIQPRSIAYLRKNPAAPSAPAPRRVALVAAGRRAARRSRRRRGGAGRPGSENRDDDRRHRQDDEIGDPAEVRARYSHLQEIHYEIERADEQSEKYSDV